MKTALLCSMGTSCGGSTGAGGPTFKMRHLHCWQAEGGYWLGAQIGRQLGPQCSNQWPLRMANLGSHSVISGFQGSASQEQNSKRTGPIVQELSKPPLVSPLLMSC